MLLGFELYNFFSLFFMQVVSVLYPESCFSEFNLICIGLSLFEYYFLALKKFEPACSMARATSLVPHYMCV